MALATLSASAVAAPAAKSNALPAKPKAQSNGPQQHLVWDSKKFMRVSELRPGMRGYALTVFKGTKIEKFHVEILGVISKFNMGKDYILFRALDGPSVTRQLNIAHGMSGSPIYINGRLVGAISMGIPGTQFPKDPIALATPIEDMFDAWSPDLPSHFGAISAAPDAAFGPQLSALGIKPGSFSQLSIPISVSGVNRRGMDWLSSRLEPYHMSVTAGGGVGGDNPLARNPSLVPGSAVGVSLVQGDIDITATGTVTYRDGNRLLLFGHPLADLGPLDAAMTTAYVVDIFPSYMDSTKLGAPIQTVGRIFQDRPFSVGGIIGSMPRMIPITVDVQDDSIKRHKVFQARVINHPLLSEQFLTVVADQAIAQVHGEPGDSQAVVTMDVDVEELGHITRTNTFFDQQAIDQSAISDLTSLLHLLSSNPFYPLNVKSVKLGVRIQNRHDTAEIDRIFVQQGKYAPGDTVDVGVVLKPYKRDYITKHLSVKIPANVAEGAFTVSVRGGGANAQGGAPGGIIILRSSDSSGPPASSVKQLTKRFLERPRNNELQVRLILPTRSIDIRGEKLSNVPPNISAALQSSHSTGLVMERDDVKSTEATPYIVTGSQALTITVQPRDQSNSSRPAPTTPPAPATDDAPADANSDDQAQAKAGQGSARMLQVSEAPLAATGDTRLAEYEEPESGAFYADAPAVPKATANTPPAGATTPGPTPAVVTAPPAKGGVTSPSPATPAADLAWKPVAHPARVWRQTSSADFATGVLESVAIANPGGLVPGPSITKLADLDGSYAWSLATTQNGYYVGTGDRGVIYRVTGSNKPVKFYDTNALEIIALATDGAGNLYAGGLPQGNVYKIAPDGHGSVWFKAPEPYITALAYDASHDRLFVATGGGTGKVYSVNSMGVAVPWLVTGEAHVLSLAVDKSGNLYAGTASNGLVYQVSPAGTSRIFYNSPESQVTAIAAVSEDRILVATAPKGNVYRVDSRGASKVLTDRRMDSLTALLTTPTGDVYGAAGNAIFKISPDDAIVSQSTTTDQQFLSLAWDSANNTVIAGAGTVASLFTLREFPAMITPSRYTSAVFDASDVASWGAISWNTGQAGGSGVTLRTRTGDTPHPDSSWSAWSSAYTNSAGQQIVSAPARYLQYDAQFGPGAKSGLSDVTAYYRVRNHAPTIRISAPQDGDAIGKTVTIQWAAVDPDRDSLSYDIAVSSDGGKTWKPLRTHYRPTPADTAAPKPATGTDKPGAKPAPAMDSAARVAQLRKELESHPAQFPPAVREQIIAQMTGSPAPATTTPAPAATSATTPGPAATAAATAPKPGETRDTTFSWDTSDTPDGAYQLRITASDRPSNPDNPLTATATVSAIVVSNHGPSISSIVKTVGPDGKVTVTGTATATSVSVKSVQFRIDGVDIYAAQAADGVFDGPVEKFQFVTPTLTAGDHKIEIQVLDRAGNIANSSLGVTIP